MINKKIENNYCAVFLQNKRLHDVIVKLCILKNFETKKSFGFLNNVRKLVRIIKKLVVLPKQKRRAQKNFLNGVDRW